MSAMLTKDESGSAFANLVSLTLTDNTNIVKVICEHSQDHWITLQSSALSGCNRLSRIQGNFILNGTRIFDQCPNLVLNDDRIYNNNPVISYPVPYISDSTSCNIKFDPNLSSVAEMFNMCSSITGNDFSMIMLLLHSNITNINRMFNHCTSVDAVVHYDIFRHCPNVIDMTQFACETRLKGGIYSRTSTYSESDTTTWGTFDFVREAKSLTGAFVGTNLQFIDNDAFAPYDGQYFRFNDIDTIFMNCSNLQSYLKYSTHEIVEGNLQSKTFFCNLKELGKFPVRMFGGCSKVSMDINSEEFEYNGHTEYFDYLFIVELNLLERYIPMYLEA